MQTKLIAALTCSLVLLLAPHSAVRAQSPRVEVKTCSIEGDGFRQALVRQAQYSNGLQAKFDGTPHSIDQVARGIRTVAVSQLVRAIKDVPTEELLGQIATRLTRLSAKPGAKTGALVYDFERAANGEITSVCAWLFDGSGLVGAEKTALAGALPSEAIAGAMGIATRSARYARKRGDPEAAAPTPEQRDAMIAATHAALEATSRTLLPSTIGNGVLGRGLDRLLILPALDFGNVPFAGLPVGPNRTLGDAAAIVVLPQVSTLLYGGDHGDYRFSPPAGPQQALVVGDPLLSADPDWIFEPLPAAVDEARFVASAFGAAPLIGADANLFRIKRLLRGSAQGVPSSLRLLYFATHGVSDPLHPFTKSFVGLTGGRLLGDDVKRMSLSDDALVVLSACQTANGRVFEGGSFGLVRSWYYAGAGQVVGSLWNVDDEATGRLMRAFVETLQSDPRPEFALRTAMKNAPLSDRADPALWSAFIVFGNPSR